MALLPELDNQLDYDVDEEQEELDEEEIELPSKTYKLNTDMTSIITDEDDEEIVVEADRIIGFVDNLEAIRQLVYKILNIERYSNIIYDDDYGVELEQYEGQGLDFLESTIEGTLEDALTADTRITGIIVDNVEQTEIDSANVSFTVQSIYGDLQMEVDINV